MESRRGAPHGEGYLATYTQTKRSSQNKQILVEYPSTHDRSSRDWWRYHQYILSCLCISKRSDRLRQVYRREDLLICNFHGHPRSGCLVEALVAGVDVVVARVQRALLLQLWHVAPRAGMVCSRWGRPTCWRCWTECACSSAGDMQHTRSQPSIDQVCPVSEGLISARNISWYFSSAFHKVYQRRYFIA